jgi:tRNA1Val (adenine37-N6)-methyltransferase
MSKNSFFRFKQFTVHQGKSAMKVCTDACVLGAWADVAGGGTILDIGTGTGLLSLMMAQRSRSVEIDAVELDENAFQQALENVSESPFSTRIQVINVDIKHYHPEKKYDYIITNPPFFQSDLRSPNEGKNKAHHAEALSFEELLASIGRLLAPHGSFHVLLPVDEAIIFRKKAADLEWNMFSKLVLYHNNLKKPFRHLMSFSRSEVVENGQINDEMWIYEADGKTYHHKFVQLMKDYYLIF